MVIMVHSYENFGGVNTCRLCGAVEAHTSKPSYCPGNIPRTGLPFNSAVQDAEYRGAAWVYIHDYGLDEEAAASRADWICRKVKTDMLEQK